MSRYLILTITIWILTFSVRAQSFELTFAERLKLAVKSQEIEQYFTIKDDGISFYKSPEDKVRNRVESHIYFGEADVYEQILAHEPIDRIEALYINKNLHRFNREKFDKSTRAFADFLPKTNTDKPLAGFRVAIDPGHIAANIDEAALEARFVRLKTVANGTVEFFEAELTFATAEILADTLRKMGAEVLISRNGMGLTAFDKTYDQWYDEDFKEAVEQELKEGHITQYQANTYLSFNDKAKVFWQFFHPYELHQRAMRINKFNPHITLVLHFNADARNRNHTYYGLSKGSPDNYNMIFVPGAYLYSEMSSVESRLNFARLLMTNHLDKSIQLSYYIMKNFTTELNVPAYPLKDGQKYMQYATNYTGYKGIYCRNLALTRLVYGPVCYGETFYQDNEAEAIRLAQKDFQFGSITTSKRVHEVAMAYFKGIMEYLQKST